MPKAIFRKQFDGEGTFEALSAAERWLTDHGFSYGSNQRGAPTGVMHGAFDIAKWRNLDRGERGSLDGVIEAGDHRNGPVFVSIFDTACRGALAAVQGQRAAA